MIVGKAPIGIIRPEVQALCAIQSAPARQTAERWVALRVERGFIGGTQLIIIDPFHASP